MRIIGPNGDRLSHYITTYAEPCAIGGRVTKT